MIIDPRGLIWREACKKVEFPLSEEAEEAIDNIIKFLEGNQQAVGAVDIISAPLLGHSLQIVGL